jgi:prepilin-type N-terminal cleavage/methylation domain-containing protein
MAKKRPFSKEIIIMTQSMPTRSRLRSAFSLVELLVVIGIAAMLLSILLPALRVAREMAQSTQCQSNLRQIGFAFMQYANENHGSMPSWSGWHATPFPSPTNPGDEVSWCGKINKIIPADSRVYYCPSFPQFTIKLHNYFMCAVWAGTNGRHSTKFSDVKMGGRFVISGDLTQLSLYPSPLGSSETKTDDYDRDDFGIPCLCFPGDGGFLMHRSGNNVLFDDLHVDTYPEFNQQEMTFHPKRMLSWSETLAAGPDVEEKKSN